MSKRFLDSLVLDENIDFLIEKKLESEGIECYRYVEGAEDEILLDYAIEKRYPLLTEDDDFKTDIMILNHSGIILDRYLSRREVDIVVKTLKQFLSTYEKKIITNEIWHLSDFYGRKTF